MTQSSPDEHTVLVASPFARFEKSSVKPLNASRVPVNTSLDNVDILSSNVLVCEICNREFLSHVHMKDHQSKCNRVEKMSQKLIFSPDKQVSSSVVSVTDTKVVNGQTASSQLPVVTTLYTPKSSSSSSSIQCHNVFSPNFGNEGDNECPHCNRTFKQQSFSKHVAICKSVFSTKRSIFESRRQRQRNTPLECWSSSKYQTHKKSPILGYTDKKKNHSRPNSATSTPTPHENKKICYDLSESIEDVANVLNDANDVLSSTNDHNSDESVHSNSQIMNSADKSVSSDSEDNYNPDMYAHSDTESSESYVSTSDSETAENQPIIDNCVDSRESVDDVIDFLEKQSQSIRNQIRSCTRRLKDRQIEFRINGA